MIKDSRNGERAWLFRSSRRPCSSLACMRIAPSFAILRFAEPSRSWSYRTSAPTLHRLNAPRVAGISSGRIVADPVVVDREVTSPATSMWPGAILYFSPAPNFAPDFWVCPSPGPLRAGSRITSGHRGITGASRIVSVSYQIG